MGGERQSATAVIGHDNDVFQADMHVRIKPNHFWLLHSSILHSCSIFHALVVKKLSLSYTAASYTASFMHS